MRWSSWEILSRLGPRPRYIYSMSKPDRLTTVDSVDIWLCSIALLHVGQLIVGH